MPAARLAALAIALGLPLAANAQLVVREEITVPLPNPADSVPYPPGGSSCNNTIADAGARAVLRAIDSCPSTFFESRLQYLSYAKQAILGIAVPGATEAAGALALGKAGENAFFCITGALIDESGANAADKAFLKALIAEVKENVDRGALFNEGVLKFREGLLKKGAAAYLAEGEVQTFLYTLDATLLERYEGLGTEGALITAGQARNDTPANRARAAEAQAQALVDDCRYSDAEIALTQAQQQSLDYLAELRAEVSKAKHLRYCIERDARLQQSSAPFDPVSPFLRHSLQSADNDIATAMARDAEQAQAIGELAVLQRSVHARRNDVETLKQRAAKQLEAARKAAGDCDWAGAASALATVGAETLECALPLDDERRARDQLAEQIELAKTQFAQLEIQHQAIIATPFSEISSCGELTLVADTYDAIPGQCRELANLESKAAALRNRARACADFKASEQVQRQVPVTGPGTLVGKATVSPVKFEDFGERGFIRTTYAETVATYERDDRANQKKATIVWNYNGVPPTLSPGQAVTITVTGGVISEDPPGAGDGLVLSGVVAIYGDVVVKTAQQADRGHPAGQYEFIVSDNPREVEIHLGGAPVGTGIIWKYTK